MPYFCTLYPGLFLKHGYLHNILTLKVFISLLKAQLAKNEKQNSDYVKHHYQRFKCTKTPQGSC